MPLPFTPKFADLVRTYTTSVGTGPLVPGAAVQGFSAFADALTAGDQFYYSVQGVDKPAEREVGRGTLQSNGTISRQPIAGSLTNFSTGTKTIALVAAAEWFSRMDQGGTGSGGPGTAQTRSQLAASAGSNGAASLLLEAGREGLFIFNGSDCSAMVAADPAQAVCVARSTDPTGTGGAWIRSWTGPVVLTWFGGRGDWDGVTGTGVGCTDNLAAFNAAIAFVKATATNVQNGGLWKGGRTLFVPTATGKGYFVSGPVEVKGISLTIEGPVTQWGFLSPVIRVADDRDGFILHMNNTIGTTSESGSGSGAAIASGLRGLSIVGGGTSTTSKGVWRRVKAFLDDMHISGFGYGDYINASSLSGGSTEGNCNGWSNHRVRVAGNRVDGAYRGGVDSNCGVSTSGQYDYNGGWGLNDEGGLGSTYVGEHGTGNGAGAYRTSGPSARHLFLNCYSEGDQPPSSFIAPTLVLGGLNGAGMTGSGAWVRNNLGNLEIDSAVIDNLAANNLILPTPGAGSQGYYKFSAWGDDTKFGPGNLDSSNWAYYITGETSTSHPIGPHRMVFNRGYGVRGAAMWDGVGVAPPSTGSRSAGSKIVLYPAVGSSTADYATGIEASAMWHSVPDASSSFKWYLGGTLGATLAGGGLSLAGALTAANFSGTSSGTNSGDQFTAVASGTFVGRSSSGSGPASALTSSQATALLDPVTGATATGAGAKGLVPAPTVADFTANRYLKANGAFAQIAYSEVSGAPALSAVALSGSAADLGAGVLAAARLPQFSGGDVVSAAAGTAALTIGTNKVVRAMLSATSSAAILGATAAGNVSDLTPSQTKSLLAIVAADVGGLSAIATSGSAADLTAGTLAAARMPAHTGDVTSSVGSVALTIGNNAVTFAKFVAASAAGIVGAGAAGNFQQLGLANGLGVSGGNLMLGAITPSSVATSGSIASSGGGVGYAAGAGGAVTQLTSKSTAVALSKQSGQITMNTASLAAAAVVTFTVTNSNVAATDTIVLNLASSTATNGSYRYWVDRVAAGSFQVSVENRSAGALAEALVLNFAILKSVAA